MTNLNEVLEFIKNSNLQEFTKIRFATDVRRSELRHDAKESFKVGDIVGIDHKKVNPKDTFTIIKINSKMIKVEKRNAGDGRVGAQMRVSPSLLVKK